MEKIGSTKIAESGNSGQWHAPRLSDRSAPSYFVVMIDYGKNGREATVDPEMTRRGAVDLVREAMSDGHGVSFVHQVFYDAEYGRDDISEEVFAEVMHGLAENGERLSRNERNFIETHISMAAARAFDREDA